MDFIFVTLITNLFVTLIIEHHVAKLYGINSRFELLVIALANCFTNLSINLILLWINYLGVSNAIYYMVVGVLEILAVLVEWVIMKRFLQTKKSKLLLSFLMNLSSFALSLFVILLQNL